MRHPRPGQAGRIARLYIHHGTDFSVGILKPTHRNPHTRRRPWEFSSVLIGPSATVEVPISDAPATH
ncbi:hypothetical protein ACFTWF_24750 [Rhodococcus sp. NPDC056960]|uniref:hypothetical protein n=1 Tax=Rhodococcus sp. NPDC056960 TaxID=3345982 RepID=UPI003631B385